MNKLLYTESGESRSFEITEQTTIIGRAPSCHLVLGDVSISREHARIVRRGERLTIRDLGSKNGTTINGVAVVESPLHDGDTIVLGGFAMTLQGPLGDKVILSEEKPLDPGGGTIVRSVEDLSSMLVPQEGAPAEDPRREPGSGTRPSAADAGAEGQLARVAKANRNLQILARVARALITVEPLHGLLEKVMELVFENIPVERGLPDALRRGDRTSRAPGGPAQGPRHRPGQHHHQQDHRRPGVPGQGGHSDHRCPGGPAVQGRGEHPRAGDPFGHLRAALGFGTW